MLYDEAGWLLLQTLAGADIAMGLHELRGVEHFRSQRAVRHQLCQRGFPPRMKGVKGLPQNYFNDVYIVTPVNQHDPDPNSMQEFMYIGEGGSNNGQTTRLRRSRARWC
jgi:hypothetical protein